MAMKVLPPPASLPSDQMTTEAWFLSRWTMFWARATHGRGPLGVVAGVLAADAVGLQVGLVHEVEAVLVGEFAATAGCWGSARCGRC